MLIAYIGQKEQSKWSLNVAFVMKTERKTESTYKEKKLYIYIYSQEKKRVQKGTKKEGLKKPL